MLVKRLRDGRLRLNFLGDEAQEHWEVRSLKRQFTEAQLDLREANGKLVQ